MANWKKIRRQFKAFDDSVYLNTAATGLIPDKTLDLVNDMYQAHARRGASVAEEWAAGMEVIRTDVAKLINASAYEVAIVPNMSIGMNWLAMMLKSSGLEIGYVNGDFPSLISPWEIQGYTSQKIQAKPNGSFSYKKLSKLDTGILAVSHVQWHTGFKLDLKKLKKSKPKDQILILDATQSLGTSHIDVKKHGVDIMFASCYKWMMAGFGSCIMYIKKDLLDKYPSKYCWQYRAVAEGHEAFPSARRFEIGHERHDSFYRLGTSLELLNKISIEEIEKRVHKLSDYLYSELIRNKIKIISNYKKEFRSQIVIIEGDFNTQLKLEKKGIFTSFRGTGIRISLHFYNNKRDIDSLIREILRLKSSKH